MNSFEETLQRIDNEIAHLKFDRQPGSLYDPIKYILSLGGKRIRPALALLAGNIYNNNIDHVVLPALGLEVFHNFTLLHDDLMDEADKRRNKPTVHKVWNANAAILSGDAMLIQAYQLICSTKSEHLKEILDLFSITALEICEGQQLDMEFESRLDVNEAEYLEMIKLKTAVLIACCLKTGAILGGAPKEDAENLYVCGINIGLAFQLKDDYLDVFGDPQTFGKNIGGDILCNKKTFLLINALKLADQEQKEQLLYWLNQDTFDPAEKISAVKKIFTELQLDKLSETKMKAYYTKALQHIQALYVSPKKTKILEDLFDQLMYRQS
ncbi:polyprenyl synthetase family protein [Parabacteroides sp. PF5-9]|uniref:polyprenyl synthetase family protein n=1 Tax=Parabacteroides sp. PF5-9 TaxID=1742404 RepID=UPI00247309B9|nr:polyprenyl synthetase family protein [Parabacteroides sp. PF5-9]MDH6358106.1 geranylgeranyl diphosphate synthase type II [Parabacteroides sp. PF5-9]